MAPSREKENILYKEEGSAKEQEDSGIPSKEWPQPRNGRPTFLTKQPMCGRPISVLFSFYSFNRIDSYIQILFRESTLKKNSTESIPLFELEN